METSDEESANSSENSYNEVVAALVGGYAIMSTMMVPPQVNPPFRDLTGRQWVQNLLQDRRRCFENFRMRPKNFKCLHSILSNGYGLASTREIDSVEVLGMFLWAWEITAAKG